MAIGVMGCLRTLPSEFPLDKPENSGNMIHANAPFEMYDEAVFAYEPYWRNSGAKSWADYVNEHCSHLIFTFANTLTLGPETGPRFERTHRLLESIEKPVVVFGLGVQSQTGDLSEADMPRETIEALRTLASKSNVVGVRGRLTKRVLNELCGIDNVEVVGCPSLFSRPEQLAQVRDNLATMEGRPAFNVTKVHLPEERALMHDAVRAQTFMVEPVNKTSHQYYVDVTQGATDVEVPYFFGGFAPTNDPLDRDERGSRYSRLRRGAAQEDAKRVEQLANAARAAEVREYYLKYYRLFRDTETWYNFNRESVSFTYGTRFHANMASVLSGKPALWITHDERTRELTEFLHLPSISIEEAQGLTPDDAAKRLDYDDFFAHIGGLFDNFNNYVQTNGLPPIQTIEL